jgi:hypothetical protein
MNHNLRCRICGCFIGYKEFESDEIKIIFTPDTEFSIEKTEYEHIKHYESGIWNRLKIGGEK